MGSREKLVEVAESLLRDIQDLLDIGTDGGADAQGYATALYMLDQVLSNSEARANIKKLMERSDTAGPSDLASQLLTVPTAKKPKGN